MRRGGFRGLGFRVEGFRALGFRSGRCVVIRVDIISVGSYRSYSMVWGTRSRVAVWVMVRTFRVQD